MNLKSIILFCFFQVCQSRIRIISYNLKNDQDDLHLENIINDFEFNNQIYFYEIINIVHNSFLIIFNDKLCYGNKYRDWLTGKHIEFSNSRSISSNEISATSATLEIPTFSPTIISRSIRVPNIMNHDKIIIENDYKLSNYTK
jgi:hypothetical protein